MPSKTQTARAERARQLLRTGGVAREDSDDELGLEDHPWEWIYAADDQDDEGDKAIVGARMGNFECKIGDCVMLKAEGVGEAWIGLICDFQDDEEGEKAANFMWFSTEREIRNKGKKRRDALPVSGILMFGVVSMLSFRAERSLYHALVGSESPSFDQW